MSPFGGNRPLRHEGEPRASDWLVGGGEMGELIRSKDWAATPVGPVEAWPQSLRSAVSILLPSRAQICLFWGPDLVAIYNDAYRPTLGMKHPRALGLPAREVWSEFWNDVLRPLLEGVLNTGEAFWASDHPFSLERHGYPEETYFDISYDPVRNETGRVGGVFCIVAETTGRVLGERRLRVLRDVGRIASDARSVPDVFQQAADVLDRNAHDVAFAGLFDTDHNAVAACRLAAVNGWPLDEALTRGELVLRGDALDRFAPLSGGAWPEPATAATVLPLAVPGQAPYGFLVAGASPRRDLDDAYQDFLRLIASSIASALAAARALEEQRARAEALADLDRAKTAFFSNVSHEFRTPLTLMLSPLEDLLAARARPLQPAQREALEIVHRNSVRLLKLVNTLLDFSRIEAGRAKARYEPVDLATFTAELASNFRSACETAGLRLNIDCPPLRERVWVDPAMWEKIVLNLVSNALKFTFEGEIALRLAPAGNRVELHVSDTGIGIAAHELPRLFERFHRVEGARARTHEGSGIGLALVQELVHLHGGEVSVASEPGRGSTFCVVLRLGSAHLPQDCLKAGEAPAPQAAHASAYVGEALGWLRGELSGAVPVAGDAAQSPSAHILVVDDNADMLGYIARLLRERWSVTTVSDGLAALEALKRNSFDLVVSDVMMPRMDGVALLHEVKSTPALADTPVMLLSARAGEEARIAGLGAGADDYIVKPFSAAQLIAQVNAQLTVQRARRESARERERLLAREQAAKREAELQREHLVALFTQAPNPIAILRGPDHVIELANPATCAIWGRRPEDVVGRPLLDALPELRGQVFGELLDRVMRTGMPYEGKEVAAKIDRRGDGTLETVYLNFVYTPLRGIDGNVEGVLVTAFDVTDEVVARREMSRLRSEAEAASRAKDEFLAMLSHELRNPLAPIVTALRLMRLNGRDVPELDVLERQAGHLTRLVDDLLDISRITRRRIELRTRRMELAEAVDKALEIANPLIEERGHKVDVRDVMRDGLSVDADPERLAQIISNLLTNAAKYSERGSSIVVQTEKRGDRVRLAVKDEGVGIAADMIHRIFDMFVQQPQTIDRSHGGLGLGLAIVRHLTELHGGNVWVRSEGTGKGSEFTVELPVAASRDVALEINCVPTGVRRAAAKRVLVVDDNRDAAKTLGNLLAHLGHVVEIAHDGPSCLALASKLRPDIAFIDIGLPGIDGYEVARQLRRHCSDAGTLLVAITGYGLEADRQRSARAGFDHHLVKPVDMAVLGELLAATS